MAHRIASEAESDLDQIWDYVARQSGSMEIADRSIDSLTDRFTFYPFIRTLAADAMKSCTQKYEAFLLAITSCCTGLKVAMCLFCACCMDGAISRRSSVIEPHITMPAHFLFARGRENGLKHAQVLWIEGISGCGHLKFL